MTSEGSEMRARTTTPASMIPSDGRQSPLSNRDLHEEVLIKDLRQSNMAQDLAAERTFLTDCLPVDVLQAVVQKPMPSKDLSPGKKERMGFKDMLPELEGSPHFIATERKRDVSFLADVKALPPLEEKPSKLDPSAIRLKYQEALTTPKKEVVLPDTMIPEEYHIKKNPSVLCLEYDGTEYKDLKEREKGLVIFPSEKPTKREEVVYLRDAMDSMLKKANLDKEINVTGTSQMKKMLANVKKEQNIYDKIFIELVRQTMVDNPDRAEILQSLHRCYNQLVNKVPIEVQSLHDEVLAQRALDKTLTEELMRFKTTIGVLTGELADIRQHDQRVSNQAQTAEDELNNALADAKRNAAILEEYHALYELQRARLEQSVALNNEEKETWSAAAYCLALKVTDEGRLNTAKRLHVAAKSWTQLASHFTLMLSDLDTEVLTEMHGAVGKWRDGMEIVSSDLIQREKRNKEALMTLRAKMDGFRTVYEQKYVINGELANIPDPDKRPNIMNCAVEWQSILMEVTEDFRNADVSNIFDQLIVCEDHADQWNAEATALFQRHNMDDDHPDWTKLKTMNERVGQLSQTVRSHLTGDNGFIDIITHVLTGVAEWLVRCAPNLEVEENVDDEEWYALDDLVNQSIDDLDKIINLIEEGQAAVVPEVLQKAHTWMTDLASGVDQMDVDMMDTVATLHRLMVNWMVHTLLLLAPPRKDEPETETEEKEEKVRKEAEELFQKVDSFSRHVTSCCWDIIASIEQKKLEMSKEAIGSDGLELDRLKLESDEWILSAKLLLRELFGGEIHIEKSPVQMTDTIESGKSNAERPKEPDVIDIDTDIPPAAEEQREKGDISKDDTDNKENSNPDAAESSQEEMQLSFQAMAALSTLKLQYKDAFERAQQATKGYEEAAASMVESKEELTSLEAAVAAASARLAELKTRPTTPEKRPALLRDTSSPRPMAALQTDAATAKRQQQAAATTPTGGDSASGLTTPATPAHPASPGRSTPRGPGVKKAGDSAKRTGGGRRKK